MHYKNMTLKFRAENEVVSVPCKTIRNIRKVYDGLIRVSTNDYVLHTISMPDDIVDDVFRYYNDWLWETDNSIKMIEFASFSNISRLNLEGEE